MALEDKYPQYQGGFIWDYIDQAVVHHNHRGEEYLAYGGDFEEPEHDGNFCCGLFAEAEMKRQVLSRAKKIIMLLDTSKVGKVMPYTFANLADIDVLVTDGNFPEEMKKSIAAQGVTII